MHEREVAALKVATPELLVETWSTLLGPADRAALTGRLAEFLLELSLAGIEPSSDGWFDDEAAFTVPGASTSPRSACRYSSARASRTGSSPSATASGSPSTSPGPRPGSAPWTDT